DLESFDTGALMNALMDSLNDAGFDVDPFLANLGRGLVTLEGTIYLISPSLNIMQVLVGYLQSSFDPSRIQQKVRRTMGQALESAEAMAGLPAKAAETLDMVQKGHAKIGMELSSNEKFSHDLHAVGGLLALALVAMGLIIGACIVGTSPTALQIGGVSAFGACGLVVGVALAIYIIVKIRPYLK
ncbi:MAG: hypothetical protein IJ087_06495, partial [Eggerthellaceae bacterium]|nr:hypothetical protein [Eggerthellaceae bacterium]